MKTWIVESPRRFWGVYLFQDSSDFGIISDGTWYIHTCSHPGRFDICLEPLQDERLPSYYFIKTNDPKAFLIVSERFDDDVLVRSKKPELKPWELYAPMQEKKLNQSSRQKAGV